MILLSKMIDYIKLASRTMNTDLSDAELLSLVEICLNQLWLDLELGILSTDTAINSINTTITVSDEMITPLKIEVVYKTTLIDEIPKVKYLLLNDKRNKDFYIEKTSDTELNLHIKRYLEVDYVRLVQLQALDIDSLDAATTLLKNQYITPILNYMAYLSYTLLGWKDYDTAQWHKGEYDRAVIELKKKSHNEDKENMLIYRDTPIQKKGFV